MIRRGTAIGKMLVMPAEAGIQRLSHWITAYIHVCCPSGQPLAVHYVMDSHEHMSML